MSDVQSDPSSRKPIIVFQSAKLGDISQILAEFDKAKRLLDAGVKPKRIYGISGGCLGALAFALELMQKDGSGNPSSGSILADWEGFLQNAHRHNIQHVNLNPWYGLYNLKPLHRWLLKKLQVYTNSEEPFFSDLPVPLYICAIDRDGTLTLFGRKDDRLQFQYQHVRIGPPKDVRVVDALIAGLSTLLSTEPLNIEGEWYRDCRPAVVDAGAIIMDLEKSRGEEHVQLIRTIPYAPIRPWKLNWITSSFIMHSQNERNQTLSTAYYLDLSQKYLDLKQHFNSLFANIELTDQSTIPPARMVGHVDLPYIGSTEASTNMRQSVQNKVELMERFRQILNGQLDHFPFEQTANVIYGAGGFSGILAGLVTTRFVEEGFARGGGKIAQVVGISAGVLNGFFHAVQIAAKEHPDLYTLAAHQALTDLENFMAQVKTNKIVKINFEPFNFWQGWANLNPLRDFLLDRLAAYTNSKFPEQITFDDIGLPLTITAARDDGFTEFMGMTTPERHMMFAGQKIQVISSPIISAMIAGWSMNTYINPMVMNGQHYRDGGGTFYDPGLFVSCMDRELTNLLNIHLDEPEGHSYHLPPRPHLVRILLDTHNYYFPEQRRRMRMLVDLLYEYFYLRQQYLQALGKLPFEKRQAFPVPVDFRQSWLVDELNVR